MVFGFFCAGSIQALSTSRMNRLYRLTSRRSATLHSRLAKHSATSGGATRSAVSGVRSTAANLSRSRPAEFPTSPTYAASQRVEAVIGATGNAGHQLRLELDHHVPGHGHDIGAAFARGRQQDDRARLEQLIDLG